MFHSKKIVLMLKNWLESYLGRSDMTWLNMKQCPIHFLGKGNIRMLWKKHCVRCWRE